jgi:hypothetical protein
MKLSAVYAVTILICALTSGSPALAAKKQTPNHMACVGAYNFCTTACDINHPIGDNDGWGRCIEVCKAERLACEINGDLAEDDRISPINPAVSLTAGGSDSGGGVSGGGGSGGGTGSGSGGGSFDPGSVASTGNAGMTTGGGGGIIQ